MQILIPVLILLGIALVCAVLLTLAATFLATPSNGKQDAVRECLPGANCGACGYNGCDGYAAALADGRETNPSLCTPGGDSTARAVAELMGLEAGDVVEMVAYVGCNGKCDLVEKKYAYEGQHTCRTANLAYNGDRMCNYACLGYGDCVRACPQGAIFLSHGIARVDPRKCIGCGICTRECPNHLFKLIKDTTRVVVECSNHERGVITRKACINGCIACGKCERTCPHGAIKVIDNLATIDYSLCTGCAECVKVCPTHCIHEGNFICGARF